MWSWLLAIHLTHLHAFSTSETYIEPPEDLPIAPRLRITGPTHYDVVAAYYLPGSMLSGPLYDYRCLTSGLACFQMPLLCVLSILLLLYGYIIL